MGDATEEGVSLIRSAFCGVSKRRQQPPGEPDQTPTPAPAPATPTSARPEQIIDSCKRRILYCGQALYRHHNISNN